MLADYLFNLRHMKSIWKVEFLKTAIVRSFCVLESVCSVQT